MTEAPPLLSEERRAELKRVAEAATRGPWRSWITRRRSPEVYTEAPPPNTPNVLITRDVIRKLDAVHIAAFDPPTALALLAALSDRDAAVAEAIKALTFYAEPSNWEDFIVRPRGRDSYFHSAHVKLDKGKQASDALHRLRGGRDDG